MKKSRVKRRSPARPVWGFCGAAFAIAGSSATLAATFSLVYATLAMPDSLVAKWLVRPLALAGAVTIGPSSGLPTSVGATTSNTAPAPAAIKPTKVGQNLNAASYWSTNRIFMNLAADNGWRVEPSGGGSTESYFDANRNIIKKLPGDNIYRVILRPPATFAGRSVDVVCRWDGSGDMTFVYDSAAVLNFRKTASSARYTHRSVGSNNGWISVYLKTVDPANPTRNFDCREAGADPEALFDPLYLDNVKRYHSVRFMDWQRTNGNEPVTWAKRTTPAMGQIFGNADGYAIEHMIELANRTGVDPWFCMPWNADEDYVRKFAEMVRDRLKPGLVAYVETSNEVWNWAFPVTKQAYQEGIARNLSSDASQGMFRRYAQKMVEQMDIWTDVFAGQTSRIVRVAASQNANSWPIKQILQYGDTATRIDAISSAPYFGLDLNSYANPTDLAPFFADLRASLDTSFTNARAYKTIADQYKLRYVPYEGGQHVTGGTVEMQKKVQSDPRMGQLYTYYLQRWNNEIGDQITLLSDIGPPGGTGAWSILDYLGQSPLATPKSRAVTLFMASIGR